MKKEIYTESRPIVMNKRIGSTLYEVNGYFNPEAQEELGEKILRIMKNDLKSHSKSCIMNVPQTGRLSERSLA